ncbi:2-dehydropantoate 2-reductase [Pokkaliibacter sp. MBI-7]|uniref:ketopantoate reductase family protein n=1 Tax=Pokkaliibacter sp. MBI-7 TaxID=3040600 RepID=UPI00244725BD|nr:2-dehydropantoate 2-reductase [Pokkaliibacter sp. MBI-7]MDH2431413.1 2-dehydropantoate 2-reductase [Pokkaliibacter sp. MBI-7]
MTRNITRVCIAGAGAIGCALAARLASVPGLSLSMLARGDTLTAIAAGGVHLTDLDGEHQGWPQVSADPAGLGPQQLIFICTKAQALPAILRTLQPAIAADTVVVPIVNGVPWWYFKGLGHSDEASRLQSIDPLGELERLLPEQHVLGAVTFMTAQTQRPGRVISTNPHLITLGEINNQPSERLEQVRQLIAAAGIEARATDSIRDPLWTKIIANLTSNPLSVVSGATLEQLYADPQLAPLVRAILDETLLTAAAYGARIRFNPPTFMQLGAGMGAVKTSMLQDYEAGRPLELATIGEAVVELAERIGLPMPMTRHTLALTRFIAALRHNDTASP